METEQIKRQLKQIERRLTKNEKDIFHILSYWDPNKITDIEKDLS